MMLLGILWVIAYIGVSWYELNISLPRTSTKEKSSANSKFKALSDGLQPKAVFKRNLFLFFGKNYVLYLQNYAKSLSPQQLFFYTRNKTLASR
jgi:hypothetical protein